MLCPLFTKKSEEVLQVNDSTRPHGYLVLKTGLEKALMAIQCSFKLDIECTSNPSYMYLTNRFYFCFYYLWLIDLQSRVFFILGSSVAGLIEKKEESFF